jgi:hypothetical protein
VAAPIEIRDHLIGPCATALSDDADAEVAVDVGALVRRLVLFERYTLQTMRMREFAALVRAFGEGGLRELLADGCLRVYCDPAGFASQGGQEVGTVRAFGIQSADLQGYVSGCFREIHAIDGLSDKQVKKLKRAIADVLVDSSGALEPAGLQFDHDLRMSAPVLCDGLALAARDGHDLQLDPRAVRIEVDRIDDVTSKTDTNVAALLELDGATAHKIVERGMLAVGSMNFRIGLMERLRGISGCGPEELPVLDGKLRSLEAEIDPDAQEQRLSRIVELAGLPGPDLTRSPAVDVDELLNVRGLPETEALRAWLRTADGLSDDEIRESFHKVQEALSRAVHGTAGKVVRFAVTTAAGFIPDGGITGHAVGALDHFLLENVTAEPGPYSFLSTRWPSLFTGS